MTEIFVDPTIGSKTVRHRTSVERQPRHRGRVPGEVGVWVFIIGDLIVFTVLFVVFSVARAEDLALFEHSRRTLSLTFGVLNTLLLLSGSMFVVQGVHLVCRKTARLAPLMLVLAIACGAAFVVNKVFEYSEKVSVGHNPSTNDFYMYYYFAFTGIHVLHLLLGLVALTVMVRIARKPVRSTKDIRNLEAGASYWHLVDLLWIVLFPLFYLMR